jgi:hypothetical protein
MNRTITLGIAVAAATLGVAAAAAAAAPHGQPAAARSSGVEHFTILSTTDPSQGTVIATGLFTTGGRDHGSAHLDKIVTPAGRFDIDHHGHATNHLNATTCLLTTHGAGTYRLADGTRAYAGLRGTGRYTYIVRVVFARNAAGHCTGAGQPTALQYVVRGSGTASLP